MVNQGQDVQNKCWTVKVDSPDASSGPSVGEWLESPHLRRIVNHLALRHGVSSEETADIFQDVCVSLIRKGMDSRVNATFVFRTITSKIVDQHRKSRLRTECVSEVDLANAGVSVSRSDDPELALLIHSRATLLPSRRTFYILRYRIGLNRCELASRLGLSRSAVRHLERRCVTFLNHGSG